VEQLHTYVRYVDRQSLEGHDFLVVRDGDHLAVFFDREAMGDPHVVEDAWDAVREVSRNVALVAPILPRDCENMPYVPAQRRADLRVVGADGFGTPPLGSGY
jgi:hypothetical protein